MEILPKIKEQLAKGFDTWTSGDVNIDEIIQKSQLEARYCSDILEWIEFSKLKDFKYSALGKVYEAYWIDGCISYYLGVIKRMSNTKVGVQYIDNKDLPEVLIQIKKYLMITDKSGFVSLFGISLNPEKNKYALVIEYIEYDEFWLLDQCLDIMTLNWSTKNRIIRQIVTLLKNLHENRVSLNYFSPENILVNSTRVKFYIFVSFGPEYIIEYTAPEILQETGRKNDPSSNIYTLGMIFYKIIFEQKPFSDIEDKSQFINKIINGTRPQFLQDIPYFLKELILKCWDADPSNRPTIDELKTILLQNSIYEFQYYNFSLNDKQEFQNMSCISERFYKTSLDISNSFQLYSGQLLKSIKSTNNKIFYDFCINFYLLKCDKHKFIKFRFDNYENGINIINKDQIIDIQMFGDSCINNISFAKMGNVKIIIKKLKNDENKSLLLKEQLNRWYAISKYHYNIVAFLGILMDENRISLILPYAHEGNLRVYLKNKKCSLEEKIAIATNIAGGILYIHKDLDIIHETLHPKNILMFGGIAKISDLPLPYDKKKFSYYDKYLFDNIGYIDPNLLLNEKFEKDKSMDIYSLGTILWEIISEVVPYSKDKSEGILQLVLKIKNNGYREKDVGFTYPRRSLVPYGYINIYKKCWNGDSLGRPKIEDIYERLILIQDNILEMSKEMSERALRGFSGKTPHSQFSTDEFLIGISLDPSNTLVIEDNRRVEQLKEIERENENKNESSEDPSWNEESIALLLIFLVERKREIDQLKKYNNIKTKFWNDAAIMLSKNGHNEYNAEQCSVKWENIKQNYEDNWYKSEVEEILDSTMKDEFDLYT